MPQSKPNQYEVARAGGVCAGCGGTLAAGEKIVAALRETVEGFERLDLMLDCWPKLDHGGLLAYWHTHVPHPEAKKKLFVDDQVLGELFERLTDATEPAKLNFRFVLGLILMRKRLLVYDTSRIEEGREIWTVHRKGQDIAMDLLNPHLDEQQVTEVSQQLGEILNEEL